MSDHAEHAHVGSLVTYALIFLALIVFTGLTVFAAFQDLGMFNAPVALIIATIKAILVVLFFMHVKESSRLTKITVTAGIFWLGLLLGLTMTDYITRRWY
jgi:cytochrome c oxidase subunit 4